MSVQYRQDLSDDIASGRLKLPGPTLPEVAIGQDLIRELRRVAAKLDKTTDERDELILRAYENGASLREIATNLGVNHVTVRNIIIKRTGKDPSDIR